jgi:putative two-component system response regulator
MGAEILSGSRSPLLVMAEQIALTHHERWDGQGYPRGLSREQIPLPGRIVAVADVFDALTHERPYKRAWPVHEALAEIRSQEGRQFDPDVLQAFSRLDHSTLLSQVEGWEPPARRLPIRSRDKVRVGA